MPINPNIILSGNQMAAPQLPDVNAMMQTRTAGMENMYKIERQRREDALAMEDRAVLQQEKTAAAEEKAVIEALLPAYTYGIETGDMTGALNLVPLEMQEGLLPYVQALEGQSPEQVRAALIGSLSASPVGQQALEAMQRAKNAEIQFGQLEVSRANAAREAAAANQPPQMTPYQAEMLKLAQAEDARKAAAAEAPQIKTDKARSKIDDTLSEMLMSYNKLKQEGAIVSTEAPGLENVVARTGAALGTTAGRALGTKAQTERDYIQSLRMNLINDIKAATGKSSQELNSNFELQAALDALSDPYGQSFETALRNLTKISRDYGLGGVAATIEDTAKGKSDLPPPPAGAATGRIPQITSDAEFDALPSGAEFIDPEGVRRRKP